MDYPFSKCEHPKTLRNKYTGETVVVPCRECNACRLALAHERETLVKLEQEYSKYTYFLTLTYDNENMPKFVFQRVGSDSWQMINKCSRLGKVDEVMETFSNSDCDLNSPNVLEALKVKSRYLHKYEFGYTCNREIALFMKRLRVNIVRFFLRYSKINNLNIDYDDPLRYYAVSEYGPETFRPHWHVLLFFNSDLTAKVIRRFVCESWQFGNVVCEKSAGKCSSYVSAYVNSFSCLSSHLQFNAVRPCCSHSQFFGSYYYRNKFKEIQELPVEQALNHVLKLGSSMSIIPSWKSFENYFFPRCSKFNSKAFEDLVYTYHLYDVFTQEFGFFSVLELARQFIELYRRSCFVDEFYWNTRFGHQKSILLKWYHDKNMSSLTQLDDISIESQVMCVARDLYISKRFLYNCSHVNYYVGVVVPMDVVTKNVRRIVDYYKLKEYRKLVEWYKKQEEYTNIYGFHGYMNFYDDVHLSVPRSLDEVARPVSKEQYFLSTLSIGNDVWIDETNYKELFFNIFKSGYSCSCLTKMDASIKHKRQNDLNSIFLTF